MAKKSFIDAIEVKSPCSEKWSEMAGNDNVRYCSHCAKSVNNLSEMTRKEAMRLVRRSNGNLCVRYEKNARTKLPVFASRISQIAKQTGAAAGVLGASLALSSGAIAQGGTANPENVQIERLAKTGGTVSMVSGYVLDPNGAVIPYAIVSLTNVETYEHRIVNASGEGFYEFKELAHGSYKLRFEAGGFDAIEIGNVLVRDGSEIRHNANMAIPQVGVVVQVGGGETSSDTWVGGVIASVSYENRNALVQAVMEEDFEEVKALIAKRAKINVRAKAFDGMSPLHAAIETGNYEIMQYLLAYGAKTTCEIPRTARQ